jgi:hypothetical protein
MKILSSCYSAIFASLLISSSTPTASLAKDSGAASQWIQYIIDDMHHKIIATSLPFDPAGTQRVINTSITSYYLIDAPPSIKDGCHDLTTLAYTLQHETQYNVIICADNVENMSYFIGKITEIDLLKVDNSTEEIERQYVGSLSKWVFVKRQLYNVDGDLISGYCDYSYYRYLLEMKHDTDKCDGIQSYPSEFIGWRTKLEDKVDIMAHLSRVFPEDEWNPNDKTFDQYKSGEISDYGSSIILGTLRFVVLHELSHVGLGHFLKNNETATDLLADELDADEKAKQIMVQLELISSWTNMASVQDHWTNYVGAMEWAKYGDIKANRTNDSRVILSALENWKLIQCGVIQGEAARILLFRTNIKALVDRYGTVANVPPKCPQSSPPGQ